MSDSRTLTRDQIREFDRHCIEDWRIPGVVLMENAGRNAAAVAVAVLFEPSTERVAVLCGAGNNGGDGFVVARHLMRQRVAVGVWLAVEPDRLRGDAKINHDVWRHIGGTVEPILSAEQIGEAKSEWARSALIVDALLGTGFTGEVRPPFDAIIHAVNSLRGPRILAVDVPSGLDCDTGTPSSHTIRAHTTVTFVARKNGFNAPGAIEYTGRVVIADIGVPLQAEGT